MIHARLAKYMPSIAWMRDYDSGDLRGDLTAGVTTAVMLIPQGMAYAMLAGLPPIHGLYASIVPLAIYALFGTSRQLAVGPVAMVSLLVATGVSGLAEGGTEAFIIYATLLGLMVGVMQFVMGVARLGFLVNFLSHPVVSGFTSAAALIIGLSQLKHLLGVDIPRSKQIHTIVIEAFEKAAEVDITTFGIGLVSIVTLVLLKKWKPNFPRAIAVVFIGTLTVYLGGLHEAGVAIVGAVPPGLPAPNLPQLELEALRELLPMALTISLVAFMESMAVAKAFAKQNRYEVDPNQELVGLGLANIGGAFFQGYPVAGGFSRTAVNASAGSNTLLSSLVTAGLVTIALLFLTPLFYYLPKAVLAAIIMVAVFGLIDVDEVKHLWKVKHSDLALLVLTFVATLTIGIEEGIAIGVLASLGWFVVRTTRPHTAVLGRVDKTQSYRNVENYPEATLFEKVLIIRMDAQFYFGNVTFLKDHLKQLEKTHGPLEHVIIDCSAINQLDSSADEALHEILHDYRRRGVELHLANVKRPAFEVMQRSGFVDAAGAESFFLTVHDAVQHVSEGNCNSTRTFEDGRVLRCVDP